MTPLSVGEICEFKYGKSLPERVRQEGSIPVFGSNGQVGRHNESFTDGETIIIGRKGSVGEVNYSETHCWPIDTTYYIDLNSLKKDVHLRWLFYALKQLRLNELNKAAAVPGLNRNDAYEKILMLPKIDEQKRIAAILDQADTLRKARHRAITLLNVLSQSIFYEMFGDPIANPKGWGNSITLGDVAEIASGITKGRKLNDQKTREIPYMAVVNVQDQKLNLDTIKYIEATEDEIQRYRLLKDDLLLTEGGDPDKLGRGTLWNNELSESIHQNHIFRVRLQSPEIDPVFLNWLVGSKRGKQYFLRSAKQTTGIASINMTQLRGFPLLIPPKSLQIEFKSRIDRFRKMKNSYATSLEKLDNLFNVLQQRAFRGEL